MKGKVTHLYTRVLFGHFRYNLFFFCLLQFTSTTTFCWPFSHAARLLYRHQVAYLQTSCSNQNVNCAYVVILFPAEGSGSLQWSGGSASKPTKPKGKKKFSSVRQKFDVSSPSPSGLLCRVISLRWCVCVRTDHLRLSLSSIASSPRTR